MSPDLINKVSNAFCATNINLRFWQLCVAAANGDVAVLVSFPDFESYRDAVGTVGMWSGPAIAHAVRRSGKSGLSSPYEEKKQLAMVKSLLDRGCSLANPGEEGNFPLHESRSGAVAKLLLDSNADIEAMNDEGETPLMHAARHARVDVVRTLLQFGAKTAVKNAAGQTLDKVIPTGAAGRQCLELISPKASSRFCFVAFLTCFQSAAVAPKAASSGSAPPLHADNGWKELVDPTSKKTYDRLLLHHDFVHRYYHNTLTGATTCDRPAFLGSVSLF